MNVAFVLNDDNKAMIAYDQPLEFEPAWVEGAPGSSGIRIISQEGVEFAAGKLFGAPDERLRDLDTVLLIHMADGRPVTGFNVPFINQSYNQED